MLRVFGRLTAASIGRFPDKDAESKAEYRTIYTVVKKRQVRPAASPIHGGQKSLDAFRGDLPELLRKRRGLYVTYNGDGHGHWSLREGAIEKP
jgi:hypothetical protein